MFGYSLSESIQHRHISEHIVNVVGVRRIVLVRPALRRGDVLVEQRILWLRLIVDRVKPDHILQESMQFRVLIRMVGCLEQRQEDIVQDVLERGHQFVGLEDVAVIKYGLITNIIPHIANISTYYNRGIWINHLMLSDTTFPPIAHFASFVHSSRLLP